MIDRSKFSQSVDVTQIQQDLREAVFDAETLLQAFEMEAVDKLRYTIQTTVVQESLKSESRLEASLKNAFALESQQLHGEFAKEHVAFINDLARLETRMLIKQRTLEQKIRLLSVSLIFLVLVIVGISVAFWLLLNHHAL